MLFRSLHELILAVEFETDIYRIMDVEVDVDRLGRILDRLGNMLDRALEVS